MSYASGFLVSLKSSDFVCGFYWVLREFCSKFSSVSLCLSCLVLPVPQALGDTDLPDCHYSTSGKQCVDQVLVTNKDGLKLFESDVWAEIDEIPLAVRARFTSDSDKLNEIINTIYRRKAVAMKARSYPWAKQQDVQARLVRAQDEALADIAFEKKRKKLLGQVPDMSWRARELYDANPSQFKTAEALHARHILLRAVSLKQKQQRYTEAEAILERLKRGESFAAVAKEVSEDSATAKNGGDLGELRRGVMVPEFEAAVFALESPGDLSPIVKTSFGLHIIQLDERIPARQKSFEDIKDALIKRLSHEWVQNSVEAWRRELVDPAKAKVNNEAIDNLIKKILTDGFQSSAASEG